MRDTDGGGSILAVGIHQYIHIKKNHAVVP